MDNNDYILGYKINERLKNILVINILSSLMDNIV